MRELRLEVRIVAVEWLLYLACRVTAHAERRKSPMWGLRFLGLTRALLGLSRSVLEGSWREIGRGRRA